MNCRQFHTLAGLEGLLSAGLAARLDARLRAHADGCDRCRSIRAWSERLPGLLRALHEEQVAAYVAPCVVDWRSTPIAARPTPRYGILAFAGSALAVGVAACLLARLPQAPVQGLQMCGSVITVRPNLGQPQLPVAGALREVRGELSVDPRAQAPAAPQAEALADPEYLDGRDADLALAWIGDDRDAAIRRELERSLPPVQDDFVQVPLPRLVDADPKSPALKGAVKEYEQAAKVVDARLFRKVTLQLKGASLDDLAAELEKQSGVSLQASRGVADEKVTVFVKDRPAREVMREVARLFNYLWARSGEEGRYRYQLVQDLRAQLAEEEMRRRDFDQALLAVHEKMAEYRPYLGQTPKQLRERAEAAKGKEQERLFDASFKWGGLEVYGRLTPAQMRSMAAGERLYFAPEGAAAPDFPDGRAEQSLPAEWRQPLIDNLGVGEIGTTNHRRLGLLFSNEEAGAIPWLGVWFDRSEPGVVALKITNGVSLTGGGGKAFQDTLASSQSPSVQRPENAKLNGKLRGAAAFTRRVSVRPEPSCPRCRPGSGVKPLTGPEWDGYTLLQKPHVSSADVWEAIHKATGMPVVADYYTHLYPVPAVTVNDQPLFDALCKTGDELGMRWRQDGDFLLARSTGFFWDKLKEVPNRDLERWQRRRREAGTLPLEEVMELVRLSDSQLESPQMGMGAVHCWGIEEWGLMGQFGPQTPRTASAWARQFYRLAAGLTPAQLQHAVTPAGVAGSALSPAQQQLAGRVESNLLGAGVRVVYAPIGWYVWEPRISNPEEQLGLPLAIVHPTAEGALAQARRLDPRALPEDVVRSSGTLAVGFVRPDGVMVRAVGGPLVHFRQ